MPNFDHIQLSSRQQPLNTEMVEKVDENLWGQLLQVSTPITNINRVDHPRSAMLNTSNITMNPPRAAVTQRLALINALNQLHEQHEPTDSWGRYFKHSTYNLLVDGLVGRMAGLVFAGVSMSFFTLIHEWLGHQGANALLSSTSNFPGNSIGGKGSGQDIEIYGFWGGGLARYIPAFDLPFAKAIGPDNASAFVSLMGNIVTAYINLAGNFLAGRCQAERSNLSYFLLLGMSIRYYSAIRYASDAIQIDYVDIEKRFPSHDFIKAAYRLSASTGKVPLALAKLTMACFILTPIASFVAGLAQSRHLPHHCISPQEIADLAPILLLKMIEHNHPSLQEFEQHLQNQPTYPQFLNDCSSLYRLCHQEHQSETASVLVKKIQHRLQLMLDVYNPHQKVSPQVQVLKDFAVEFAGLETEQTPKTWQSMRAMATGALLTSPLIRVLALNSHSEAAQNAASTALVLHPLISSLELGGQLKHFLHDCSKPDRSIAQLSLKLIKTLCMATSTAISLQATTQWLRDDFGIQGIGDILGGWQLPAILGLGVIRNGCDWISHICAFHAMKKQLKAESFAMI